MDLIFFFLLLQYNFIYFVTAGVREPCNNEGETVAMDKIPDMEKCFTCICKVSTYLHHHILFIRNTTHKHTYTYSNNSTLHTSDHVCLFRFVFELPFTTYVLFISSFIYIFLQQCLHFTLGIDNSIY